MNKTPSILVDTGFEVDQNGALTEIVVPSVVTTLSAPRKVVFNGTTLNWLGSTTAALQEFVAPNCSALPANLFKGSTAILSASIGGLTTLTSSGNGAGMFYGCTNLTTLSLPLLASLTNSIQGAGTCGEFYNCTSLTSVSLPSLTTISSSAINHGSNSAGAFYGCTGLTSISLPALTKITTTISSGGATGAFYGCTGLTSVSLPALTTLDGSGANTGNAGAFFNCTSLKSVSLPSLLTCSDTSTYQATFGNCTSLESVQLGSEGHAVTSLGAYMFKNCTQSNLTITIYTAGGASLSGEPWGATNADIEYEEA